MCLLSIFQNKTGVLLQRGVISNLQYILWYALFKGALEINPLKTILQCQMPRKWRHNGLKQLRGMSTENLFSQFKGFLESSNPKANGMRSFVTGLCFSWKQNFTCSRRIFTTFERMNYFLVKMNTAFSFLCKNL